MVCLTVAFAPLKREKCSPCSCLGENLEYTKMKEIKAGRTKRGTMLWGDAYQDIGLYRKDPDLRNGKLYINFMVF
jgi:hypothetical protein